jgi:hypothetical protein
MVDFGSFPPKSTKKYPGDFHAPPPENTKAASQETAVVT